MITVILGPDRALARSALMNALTAADPSGDNTSWFDSQSDPLSAVIAALVTRTFLADERVVVAQGYLPAARQSAGGKGKRTRKPSPASASSPLETLLATAASQGILFMFEPGISAIPAGSKSLLPPETEIIANAPPRGTALIDFTKAAAAKEGTSIDRQAAERLLNQLFPGHWNQAASNPAFDKPPDMELLTTEIQKLALYAGSQPIDEGAIDALTPSNVSDRMFPLLDAAVSGNQGGALRELQHVPLSDDERSRLLAMIGQQIEFAAASTAPGRPRDPLQAGSALGMSNPNRMKAILRSASGSASMQAQLLRTALEADRRLKTGLDSTPSDAIYRVIGAARPTNR